MVKDGSEIKTVYYTYDKNNRLLQESADAAQTIETSEPNVTVSIVNGKKTTITTVVVTTTVVEDVQAVYTYDANGNTLTITDGNDVTTYTYDARNQQVSYSLNGTTLANYTYYPDGLRRTKHVLLNLAQLYIWSGGMMVYECELLNPNNGTAYIYGINLIAAKNSSTIYTYYLYNAHGDVVQLVNGSGTVTKTYHYDAFGVEYSPNANDANYFRYCGEYFDTETGTYYLRARYYNPNSGRFTQEDPIGADGGSLNFYTYCNNNPIMFIDPSGMIIIFPEEPPRYLFEDDKFYKTVKATYEKAKAEYERAIEYLMQSETFAELYKLLTESKESFLIIFNRGSHNEFVANTEGASIIYWDPTCAAIVNDSTVMSPAMALAHEMGHAAQYLAGEIKAGYKYNPQQTLKIEEANVKEYETPIAKELGEHTRLRYKDAKKTYRVTSSTDWGYFKSNAVWYKPWTWGNSPTFINQNTRQIQ